MPAQAFAGAAALAPRGCEISSSIRGNVLRTRGNPRLTAATRNRCILGETPALQQGIAFAGRFLGAHSRSGLVPKGTTPNTLRRRGIAAAAAGAASIRAPRAGRAHLDPEHGKSAALPVNGHFRRPDHAELVHADDRTRAQHL